MVDTGKRYSCWNRACPHSWHYVSACPQARASNNSHNIPPSPALNVGEPVECGKPDVEDMYLRTVSRLETVAESGGSAGAGDAESGQKTSPDTELSADELVAWWKLSEPSFIERWDDESYASAVAYTKKFQEFIRMTNPSDSAVRVLLSSDTIPSRVGVLLSCSEETPASVLAALAEEGDALMQANVGANPTTSQATLRRLVYVGDRSVRLEVAGNPNTPVDVLELLATYKNETDVFKKAIIRNRNVTSEILADMSENYAELSRQRIFLDSAEMRAEAGVDPTVLADIAQHPLTPDRVLERLAGISTFAVLRGILLNPRTPDHILDKLAIHPNNTVRIMVKARRDRTLAWGLT